MVESEESSEKARGRSRKTEKVEQVAKKVDSEIVSAAYKKLVNLKYSPR